MNDPENLRKIRAARDVTSRQEYVVEGGMKRLARVVWSSASLGLAIVVPEPAQKTPAPELSGAEPSIKRSGTYHGHRERKE